MSYRLLSETRPIARKAHKCIWCGEPIPAGDQYVREKSFYEDHMQNHAWHFECNEVASEQFRSGDCEFSAYENERADKSSAEAAL